MPDLYASIRNQLDLLEYTDHYGDEYVKQASYEPHCLSKDLDEVMQLYKEAGFWGNAWDFTKNLGLSTIGLADDKHQWMNYVTPMVMMAIPGIGIAGGAAGGIGRLAAGQGLRFLGREAAKGAVKQTAKQVGKNLANQGAKQIVRRRGLNAATGYRPRVNMPTTEQWVEMMNKYVIPDGAKKIIFSPRTGVTQGAKNVVSGGVNKGLLGSVKGELRNELVGVGQGWGGSVWDGMNGWQRAGDIAKGVLWGGSRNNAVNWGSWAVPQLASQFTDNEYIDNWATARTNLGFMSPGLNRLSGWGAKKMMPGQTRHFRPAESINPGVKAPATPVASPVSAGSVNPGVTASTIPVASPVPTDPMAFAKQMDTAMGRALPKNPGSIPMNGSGPKLRSTFVVTPSRGGSTFYIGAQPNNLGANNPWLQPSMQTTSMYTHNPSLMTQFEYAY